MERGRENLVWKNTLLPLLQCTVFSTEQMHFLLKFREREDAIGLNYNENV